MNWVVGMLIFFVMLGLGFTGYLLPWDNKAYFATKVGIQIAASVPFIGDYIKDFLQGGDIVGAQTLTRFFALHVFFLPAALLALLGAHFYMIRKQGISGPLDMVIHEGRRLRKWPAINVNRTRKSSMSEIPASENIRKNNVPPRFFRLSGQIGSVRSELPAERMDGWRRRAGRLHGADHFP